MTSEAVLRLSGGCHPRARGGRCFSSTPWNSSPRRLRRRYAIHRNQAPKNSFRHVLTCPAVLGEEALYSSRVLGEGIFRSLAGHIWHEAAGCSGCRRLLGMNDRRCVIWQKSRERKRRRKDFGMMDRRRDGGVREGRRIPISIHLWESVSFSNGKTREKGRERDIEVAE